MPLVLRSLKAKQGSIPHPLHEALKPGMGLARAVAVRSRYPGSGWQIGAKLVLAEHDADESPACSPRRNRTRSIPHAASTSPKAGHRLTHSCDGASTYQRGYPPCTRVEHYFDEDAD